MSDSGSMQPPPTPRWVCSYMAVPTDDTGLSEAASCTENNLKWAAREQDKSAPNNWRAYQNLVELSGILKTAGIGNAAKVWEHVVEFVENSQMAQCELPPTKIPKTTFKTAQDMLNASQHAPQSMGAASALTAKAEPCAGSCAPNMQYSGLSDAQIAHIAAKREQALAIKQAKQQQQERAGLASAPPTLPTADLFSGQPPR